MAEDLILYSVEDGIARITLNRPQVLNARNPEMRAALVEAARRVDSDPDVRVALLAGAGERAFCTGMDLKSAPPPSSPVQAHGRRKDLSDVEALAAIRKPTIACLHGYTLGGGLELALACDLRVATLDAKIGLPEVTRGLLPGSGGTQRLPRLIGVGPALEMIMTGKIITGEEAARIGLVSQAVPAGELEQTCLSLARSIAKNAPLAVRYAKEAIRKGSELPLAAGLDLESGFAVLLTTSEDYAEGIKAFAEKRPPLYRGI